MEKPKPPCCVDLFLFFCGVTVYHEDSPGLQRRETGYFCSQRSMKSPRKRMRGWGGDGRGRGEQGANVATLFRRQTIFEVEFVGVETSHSQHKPLPRASAPTAVCFHFLFVASSETSLRICCKELKKGKISSHFEPPQKPDWLLWRDTIGTATYDSCYVTYKLPQTQNKAFSVMRLGRGAEAPGILPFACAIVRM